jgi:phage repressor protein C with HTH and peptisase S24 domain
MSNTHVGDSSRQDGIVFTVTVGSHNHKCLITPDALKSLCPSDDDVLQLKEIFWEYEDHIQWVARRLVSAGEWGNPLILEPKYFS